MIMNPEVSGWPQNIKLKHMKRIPKGIIISGFIAVLVAGAIAYTIYSKPHVNIDNSNPEFNFTALEFYTKFKTDDSTATQVYRDKIIELSGVIDKIVSIDDSNTTILLAIDNEPLGNIKCGMDPKFNERLKKFNANSNITIKGICTGSSKTEEMGLVFLDIELARCVVVTKKQ